MAAELHLNKAQLGILFSAFFWTYALVQIPIGWVAERYGAERVLAAGLTLWAVATMCVGLTSGFVMLILLRLLLGLGESTGFPCVSKLLAGAVAPAQLGTANGIVGFGYLIGPSVGTLLGGGLMTHFGWRAVFVGFGLASLLWLWPWSRVVKQRNAPRTVASLRPTFRTLLRQPSLWGTILGLFSINYTFYFMLTWLPTYLVDVHGLSMQEMTNTATAAYAVTAVSALVAGWAIDRMIARGTSATLVHKSVMAVAHVGAVLCMLAMATGQPALAIACIFIYQFFCGISSPGVYAIPQILAGSKASGRWIGIQNATGNLAGVTAPAATGFIVHVTGHFTAAFLLAAAVSVLGVVGWVFMVPKLAPLNWDEPEGHPQ